MIPELFKKRVSAFYSSWTTNGDDWGNSDIIVVTTPPENSNSRSSLLFVWLFGEDLADTTAVFSRSSMFFLCRQESFSRLRRLGGYATEVLKIPVSVELKPRNDAGVYKLDSIITSMRQSPHPGKSKFSDFNCLLTVGCIDNEMPKSKILFACVNGLGCYYKYMIGSVNSGLGKMIFQGEIDSVISKIDNVKVDDIQFNRGVKRTIEDRMDILDKGKAPLLESSGKLERPNQSAKSIANKNEKVENTQPRREVVGSDELSRLERMFSSKKGKDVGAKAITMFSSKKLALFYSSWKKYRKELWGDADVLIISSPPSESLSASHDSISSSFYLWLFGCDFPNTTAVFMDHAIEFICPNESFPVLCPLGSKITGALKVSVSVEPKGNANDELELLDATLYGLRAPHANDPVMIGYIDGESPNSKVLDRCVAKLDEKRFQSVNVIRGFVKLLKEEGGLESHQGDIQNLAENYQLIMSLANTVSSEVQKDEDENNNVMHKSEETKQLAEEVNSNLQPKFAEMNILQEKCENNDVMNKTEETNQLAEEVNGNLRPKFAEMNILYEDGRESKLVAEEGNSHNADEQVVLAVAETEQNYQSSDVKDDAIDNPCNQPKDSVVSDDDWEVIEKQEPEPEPETAIDSSWRRWIGW